MSSARETIMFTLEQHGIDESYSSVLSSMRLSNPEKFSCSSDDELTVWELLPEWIVSYQESQRSAGEYIYDILNKDTVFARFTLRETDLVSPFGVTTGHRVCDIEIVDTALYESVVGLLDLQTFIEGRKAPKHRAHIKKMFAYLDFTDIKNFIDISYGLSMNDTIWIRPKGDSSSWTNINLYDNTFNDVIAHYAFSGVGLLGIQFQTTSPEFSTNGALPKMWKYTEVGPHLYKGSTSYLGISNSGFEPYAEYYAAQIAKRMDFYPYVEYDLRIVDGELVSDCSLFTSKETAYVSASKILQIKKLDASQLYGYLDSIGFLESYNDILFFDCVICNPDRHYGNFGILTDTNAYSPISMAPIFDNGMSLGFNWTTKSRMSIIEMANEPGPCLQPDFGFIDTGKALLNEQRRAAIERLRNWEIPKHPMYNFPAEKYEAMNDLLQHQIKKILS